MISESLDVRSVGIRRISQRSTSSMMGKPNSEESDISQDSILTSTQIAEPETQDIDSGQDIDNATVLLFKDTLTKHLSIKKEDGKVKLKWNGTLIDFRDFVSLILEFKGNRELKHQDNYDIHSFKEAK